MICSNTIRTCLDADKLGDVYVWFVAKTTPRTYNADTRSIDFEVCDLGNGRLDDVYVRRGHEERKRQRRQRETVCRTGLRAAA